MKIGIFGDSYADRTSTDKAWWRRLNIDHNHCVTSYGFNGSSIFYSTKLLKEKHQEFDFNIWCMTTPGRFSVPLPGNDMFFHSTNAMNHIGQPIKNKGNESDMNSLLATVCQQYLKYVFDWETENLVGKAVAQYFLQLIPNLMIIPCFPPPLDAVEFNLYDLCSKELQQVFPNQEVHEIYQSWHDQRACHLTEKNNVILADIINSHLVPGIFKTEYSNFCFDNLTLDSMVAPK